MSWWWRGTRRASPPQRAGGSRGGPAAGPPPPRRPTREAPVPLTGRAGDGRISRSRQRTMSETVEASPSALVVTTASSDAPASPHSRRCHDLDCKASPSKGSCRLRTRVGHRRPRNDVHDGVRVIGLPEVLRRHGSRLRSGRSRLRRVAASLLANAGANASPSSGRRRQPSERHRGVVQVGVQARRLGGAMDSTALAHRDHAGRARVGDHVTDDVTNAVR